MAENNIAGFKKLMRYAQNLAEYEQGIADGIIDENVFVIVLEEKVAKFKGETFDWSGGGSDVTVDSEMSDTSENPVQNKVVKGYVDEKVANITGDKVAINVTISQDETTTIKPNTYYKWSEDVTSLTVILAEPEDNSILNNYMFEFKASQEGCSLSMPDTIIWADNTPPVIEAGKTYQISIINSLAVVQSFG